MYYVYKCVFYLLRLIAFISLLPVVVVPPFAWLFDYLINSANKVRRYAIKKYKDKYNEEVNRS